MCPLSSGSALECAFLRTKSRPCVAQCPVPLKLSFFSDCDTVCDRNSLCDGASHSLEMNNSNNQCVITRHWTAVVAHQNSFSNTMLQLSGSICEVSQPSGWDSLGVGASLQTKHRGNTEDHSEQAATATKHGSSLFSNNLSHEAHRSAKWMVMMRTQTQF